MSIRRKISILAVILFLLIGGFFYVYYQIYFSQGEYRENKTFEIVKGDGSTKIGNNLEKENLISNDFYFFLYVWKQKSSGKFLPGKYEISGNLTIPEIVKFLTDQENMLPGYITITFPEGWTAKQMSERLSSKGFDGENFLKLVNNPPQEIVSLFPVLNKKPAKATLEGYLFPDTYKFAKEATPEGILKKILNNTEIKITDGMRTEIENQKKSVFEILTMASLLEKEVKTPEDFKIVSGIFWKRIAIGQALQSCATLAYILGVNKSQYSYADTQIESPYNTYKYKGLPPGPVSNPGIETIQAALYPEKTDYLYFLTDPQDPKNTVYSKTLEEHNRNKAKYGL
ncbi:MAG TPA: endolytic transglycosylase MltG [Candidatus Moranbacteria bacterium]|nr:endolytic transglycosylase MltG [Candidatus Moranbacteria bacterium]